MVYRWTDGAGRREVLSAGHGEEGKEWRSVESRPIKFMIESLEEMGEFLKGGDLHISFPTCHTTAFAFHVYVLLFQRRKSPHGYIWGYGLYLSKVHGMQILCIPALSAGTGIFYRGHTKNGEDAH